MRTLEQRIARAERMLKMFVRSGRKYRKQFRENVEILIHMQMRDNEEWRARQRVQDEKLNILINAQIATDDQMKRTDERIEAFQAKTDQTLDRLAASQAKTDQTLDRLAASQAKTDEALERFLDGLSKGRNGNSSD